MITPAGLQNFLNDSLWAWLVRCVCSLSGYLAGDFARAFVREHLNKLWISSIECNIHGYGWTWATFAYQRNIVGAALTSHSWHAGRKIKQNSVQKTKTVAWWRFSGMVVEALVFRSLCESAFGPARVFLIVTLTLSGNRFRKVWTPTLQRTWLKCLDVLN